MATSSELLNETAIFAAVVVTVVATAAARKRLGLSDPIHTTQLITADDVVGDLVKCRCPLSVQQHCYK